MARKKKRPGKNDLLVKSMREAAKHDNADSLREAVKAAKKRIKERDRQEAKN